MTTDQSTKRTIKVWDMPTRFFHWSLASLILVAFISAEAGASIFWVHIYTGTAVLGLVAFRLVWGVWGSRYARFDDFVHGPETVGDYAKKLLQFRPPHHVGHNPLGGWMVVALLATVMVISLSGLMTSEDGYVGPLAFIGGGWMGELHEGLGHFWIPLVALHVGGVVVHGLISRENLVRAMFTGKKHVSGDEADKEIKPIGFIRPAIAIAIGLAVGGYFLWI
ncbi:cytochrome b/b6 domain-containing protein [Magnetovibrio sp. PR-2]|uniref:cytochrome b/b6 domain-containing protein n=1 Tax=Magnetovibrio sp. PR-2 TaxID=3120356 RepID=UPI002FCE6067